MTFPAQFRGIAAMLLSGLSFVINDTLMKIAMVSLPPYEVLTLRGVFGFFCALGLLALYGEVRWRPEALSRPVLLRAGFECGAILTYILALARAPIGDVTAIFQTTPLLVILGLVLFQGETASALRLGLVGMGFVGALLVAQPGSGVISPYVMLTAITACFAALRDLAARRVSSAIPALLSTLVLITVVLSGALICGLLFERWEIPTPRLWLTAACAGLAMMLGHHFTLVAYRNADAQTVAPFYYSFMIFAVITGYAVFGDVPNALGLAGMAVIMASGLAILTLEKRGKADVFQSPDL